MSEEEVSLSSASQDDFDSEIDPEEEEDEAVFSEDKEPGEEDEEEEDQEEDPNGEPDPWVDDGFDDDLSQGSESAQLAGNSGFSSFVPSNIVSPLQSSVVTHSLSHVAQNKKPTKQTNNYMTAYEFTKILGVRSEQIMHGSQVLVQTSSKDPIEIAKEELRQKVIPLKIRRTIPDRGGVRIEDWSVTEFQNINTLLAFYNY